MRENGGSRYTYRCKKKIIHLLSISVIYVSCNQVCATLIERENRAKKFESLEARFGAALTALQEKHPTSQPLKRARLLKIMERFGGDVELVQKCLQRKEAKQNPGAVDSIAARRQHREELRTKYATQLAELTTSGINVKCPCILSKLEQNQGDVNKVESKDRLMSINRFNYPRYWK